MAANDNETKIIDLTLTRPIIDPSTILYQLSTYSKSLLINKQDVYGDYSLNSSESSLKSFEDEIASYLHHDYGLFLISGCMAQSIVLAICKEKYLLNETESKIVSQVDSQVDSQIAIGNDSNKFVCHYSSHLLLHEESSYSKLLQLEPIIIPINDNLLIQQPISYHDIKPYLDSTPKPICVIIELPHREIGGKITSYEDLVLISNHCRLNQIHLHLDGARLWEALAAYNQSISDITQLFDSIYVSFYKGIGGLTGSMLLTSKKDFFQSSRIWNRRFGGNVYTYLPYIVSCWQNFRDNKDSFIQRKERLIEIVHILTNELKSNDNNQLVRFDPEIPVVSLIHIYISANYEQCMKARDESIIESGISCFNRVRVSNAGLASGSCYLEMNLGKLNGSLSNDTWIYGWKCFLKHLTNQLNNNL